jgi:hypothetical protein
MQPIDSDNGLSKRISIGLSQRSTYSKGYCDWMVTIDYNSYTESGSYTATFLANFDGILDFRAVESHICEKQKVCEEIHAGSRAYWKKRNHREYQKAVAQWVQRELELPGEIAEMVLSFT